jgi:hypothetical protein
MHTIPGSRIVSTGKTPFALPSMDIAPLLYLSGFVIIFYFLYFTVFRRNFDYVICQHTTKYMDRMFGLPDITILTVGITIVVVIAALLYWGLTFKGHD